MITRVTLLLGGVVALSLLAVHGYGTWTRKNLELANAQLQLAAFETADEQNRKTIKSLRDMRKRDDKALTDMNDAVQRVVREIQSVRQELTVLAVSNEEVRSYLDSTVPPDLGRLLDTATQTADSSRAARGTAAFFPTPAPQSTGTGPTQKEQ
ncbi:hypothetical protein [Microcystis phage Me-ZS1]|nr:hypothetical protein [Microcystis phage Me-ZS1]